MTRHFVTYSVTFRDCVIDGSIACGLAQLLRGLALRRRRLRSCNPNGEAISMTSLARMVRDQRPCYIRPKHQSGLASIGGIAVEVWRADTAHSDAKLLAAVPLSRAPAVIEKEHARIRNFYRDDYNRWIRKAGSPPPRDISLEHLGDVDEYLASAAYDGPYCENPDGSYQVIP